MRHDDSTTSEIEFAGIMEGFVARYRAGERPGIEEYLARYPQHKDQINALFPTVLELEHACQAEVGGDGGSTWSDIRDERGDRLERLGDYHIIREAGRGGMGIVYEAEQQSLGRRVALKVLPAHALLQPRQIRRFQREARAVAKLHHTNIVPVFGVGEQNGVHYYVMQLITGKGLDQVIDEMKGVYGGHPRCEEESSTSDGSLGSKDRRERWVNVARIGIEVGEALAYARDQGVLHRDIKPSNLLLDSHGTTWVTDFGLAKAMDGEDMTQTGEIVGTLRYLAPERFHNRFDHRSDLYSLGLTLYEAVTLRPAFEPSERAELIEKILHVDPPAPRSIDPSIPKDLETIILKLIAKDPEGRYPTARLLVEDLQRWMSDRPIRARRVSRLERSYRWCRRNPMPTSLLFALVFAIIGGVSGITWKWREAVAAQGRESLARAEADASANQVRQGMKDLQEAFAYLEWGRFHAEKSEWDTANNMYSKSLTLRPDLIAARRARAELYGLLSLWEHAAQDYAEVFRIQAPDTTNDWYRYALLQYSLGDETGYLAHCQRMREQFAGTNDMFFVSELLRTVCLSPHSVGDRRDWVALAREYERNEHSWYSTYLLGVVELRAGQYQKSSATLAQSIEGVADHPVRAIGYPVHAMALFHSGDRPGGEDALKQAEVHLRRFLQVKTEYQQETLWMRNWNAAPRWPVPWWDWIEFLTYYREAKLLITGAESTEFPNEALIRARSFASLRAHDLAEEAFQDALRHAPDDRQIQLEAYRNRGYRNGRQNHWSDAADAFCRVTDLMESDVYAWRFRAHCELAMEREELYRQSCSDACDKLKSNHDPRTACVLLSFVTTRPNVPVDREILLDYAERAAKFFQLGGVCKGAVLYRVGEYASAVELLEERAQTFQPNFSCYLFLAMAHHRLGNVESARVNLELGEKWIAEADRIVATQTVASRSEWGAWDDPVAARSLLQEARGLIRP